MGVAHRGKTSSVIKMGRTRRLHSRQLNPDKNNTYLGLRDVLHEAGGQEISG